MYHWLVGPDALIEIVVIFREPARIQCAGGGELGGPTRLAKIIDADPDEIAANVVIGLNKFLLLFHLDGSIRSLFKEKLIRLVYSIDSACTEERSAFRADESAIRISMTIDAVIFFTTVTPTITVVIPNDIEFFEKLRQSRLWLRRDLVATHSD